MKVLQLIDSLRPGGAERMAVNLANSLVPYVEGSYLCCSRLEGRLKENLDPAINYLFLGKNSSIDFNAVKRLKRYIRNNNINIIHAHGTSYFLGVLLKITGLKVKLVWHEHLGARVLKKKINFPVLYISSFYFDGIITVNKDLLNWVELNLKGKNKTYIPNFVLSHKSYEAQEVTLIEYKYIVCLANLKVPKNHLNLLNSFLRVVKKFPEYKLYLIGKNYTDDYKNELEQFIKINKLGKNIIFKGEVVNNFTLLKNAKVGVLSSDSEGLPMTLLEYGNAGIPVVCTAVGQCGELVGEFGKVVAPNDSKGLAEAIIYYLEKPKEAKRDGLLFKTKVEMEFLDKKIIPEFLKYYNLILFQ